MHTNTHMNMHTNTPSHTHLWCAVWLHNSTLQNGNVSKRYVLQNGTRYKTVRVTKRYVLQNGMRYKTVMLQNGTWYKTVRYKTVHVTKRYIFYTVLWRHQPMD